MAIDGDIAVVGAPGRDDDGSQSGAAFVFTRSGVVWTEQQRLIPSFAYQDMRYGTDVAIDNGTIIVGAAGNDERGTDAGAAYVFVLFEGVWTEQAKLTPLDATSYDYLGDVVALQGDTAGEDDTAGDTEPAVNTSDSDMGVRLVMGLVARTMGAGAG